MGNFKRTSPSSSLRSSSGSVILTALVAIFALGVSVYFISDSVLSYQLRAKENKNQIELRLTLHSIVDFVIFGIKQKYCFDAVLMQDSSCSLKHKASVERLIMSVDQLNSIKTLIKAGKITDITEEQVPDIPLKEISLNFSLGDYSNSSRDEYNGHPSTDHPLYVLFKSPTLREMVKGVKVKIVRDNSLYLPRYGGEVYVNIFVELVPRNEEILGSRRTSSDKLRMSSRVSIHPREVGSFALLVANDLYLDRKPELVPSSAKGSSAFTNFPGDTAKSYPGIVFLSPVFVNRDIYMPGAGTYTPVTFADRVYMGNGSLRSGEQAFVPRSSGGSEDRYWFGGGEGFGGFLKGVENDGGLDRGLSVFGGSAPSAMGDWDLMKKCIARTQLQVNNLKLLGTNLSAVPKGYNRNSSKWSANYIMQMSEGDEFVTQRDSLGESLGSWNSANSSFNRTTSGSKNTDLSVAFMLISTPGNERSAFFDMKAISELDLLNGGEYVELNMNFAKDFLDALKNQISGKENQIHNIERSISNETNDKKRAESRIAEEKENIDQYKKEIAEKEKEKSKLDTTDYDYSRKLSRLEEQIRNLQDRVRSSENRIASETIRKQAAEAAIAAAEAAKAPLVAELNTLKSRLPAAISKAEHPTKVRLTLSAPGSIFSRNKLNVQIEFENETSLIDKDGSPYNVSMMFTSYNRAYVNKQSILRDADGRRLEAEGLKGYLNFAWDATTNKYSQPSGLSGRSDVEDKENYEDLEKRCQQLRDAQDSQAFGSANQETDFSGSTRGSWNFAGTGATSEVPGTVAPLLSSFTIDIPTSDFQVKSIVGNCIIGAKAEVVTGFFSCDVLTIQARSKPLRIIGSFIVGRLNIDPSAYSAGIIWSSIYHPQATLELRKIGVLQPLTGGVAGETCNTFNSSNQNPIWHPIPSVQYYSNRESCNVISLRAKADPFRWTSVDPDCGLIAGKTNTVCKNKLVRFYVLEHSRGEY